MVLIPSGTFEMGSVNREGFHDEYPRHVVKINSFWMDKTEVTNAQFKKFVDETGYITIAERKIDWEEMKKSLPSGTPKPHDSILQPGSTINFNWRSRLSEHLGVFTFELHTSRSLNLMKNKFAITEPIWFGLIFIFFGWLYTTFQVVFASIGPGFDALGPGMQFFDLFRQKIFFGPESIIFYLPICTTLEAGWSVKTWLESFLMWVFMIFAMMLPSLLPFLNSTIISFKIFCRFMLGYLAVWMLFCVVGIFIQWFLHSNHPRS